MTREHDTGAGEDPIVGDSDAISIGAGDRFDYVLSRPGGEFGFGGVEIPELRERLKDTQGDG